MCIEPHSCFWHHAEKTYIITSHENYKSHPTNPHRALSLRDFVAQSPVGRWISGLFHYATSSRSPQFVVHILINGYLTKTFHYAAAPRSPEYLLLFSSRGCATRSPFPCARMGHSIIPHHSVQVPFSYASWRWHYSWNSTI